MWTGHLSSESLKLVTKPRSNLKGTSRNNDIYALTQAWSLVT